MKNHIKQKLSYLKRYMSKRKYITKVNKIHKKNLEVSNYSLDRDQKKLIDDFWGKYGMKCSHKWHQAYMSVNGHFNPTYIPEDIFYNFIIPKLGRLDLFKSYADKNMYDKLFPMIEKPKTIIRNIHGRYYDYEYNNIDITQVKNVLEKSQGEYIIKPSIDSRQGSGVNKVLIDSKVISLNDKLISFQEIERMYLDNFLIQEAVEQHELLNSLYSHSLNTLRMTTLRDENNITLISSVLRLGNNGLNVDNYSLGGIAIGLDHDGNLNDFGIDNNFKKHYEHPYTKHSFKGLKIPNFTTAINLVENAAKELLYFDLASWDVAFTNKEQFSLIEVNLGGQAINIHQANNGPLFGKKSEQILDRIFDIHF